jgi:hypothetical protein
VEKAISKEKSNIAPANIIAKVQLKWPSKTFGITSPGVYYGNGTLLTPTHLRDASSTSILANFSSINKSHPHFDIAPSLAHKICKAHGWRTNHDTEDCYRLRDLRKDIASEKGMNNRGRVNMRGNNRGNRGGYNGRRVNAATAANAICQ